MNPVSVNIAFPEGEAAPIQFLSALGTLEKWFQLHGLTHREGKEVLEFYLKLRQTGESINR